MGKRIVKVANGVYVDPERVVSVHQTEAGLGVSMSNNQYYEVSEYANMAQLLGAIWPGYVVAG